MLILTASDLVAFYQELNTLDVVIHQHKNENVLDISPKGVHKWSALQALGIQDYIAFGNDANDITMFQHAKHSVMIRYHKELATYASETIAVKEEKIVEKVYELVEIYDRHLQLLF